MLFYFDDAAHFFDGSFQLLSLFLRQALFDGFRSIVYQVFGFLQAESGQFTDSLNNLNLVSADFFQNDVEFGFFFSRSSSL